MHAALHELLSSHPNISTSLRTCELLQKITTWQCYRIIVYYVEFVCYDDGCHLRQYARNPCRSQITPCSAKLANVEIVIDKMHMAEHTDKWCHQNCNPRAFKELENVNYCYLITVNFYLMHCCNTGGYSEVCEQHFSWLSKYAKITRRMNRNTFIFFLLYIIDMHNRSELQKLQRGGFL